MRVVHVTYQHSADDARILHKQCRTLAEAEFETHLIAPGPPPAELFGVRFHALTDTEARGAGVEHESASSTCRLAPSLSGRGNRIAHGRGLPGRLRHVRRWFEEIESIVGQIEPDIVHVHDPLLLRLAKRLRGRSPARLVYDAHEDHARQIRSLSHLPWLRRQVQALLYGWLERTAPRFIDLFITATPGIANQYPAARTIVVRNLPRLGKFPPAESNVHSNRFVYVGGLTRSRGLIEMIEAIAQVRSDAATLVLAGRFDNSQTQRLAESRPGWSRVEYRGWVPHAQVPGLLREAAAGMVVLHPKPNYVDAWPVKLFEYMAAGLPFIASDFAPWRAMLGEARCGVFVDPLDVRAIADSMNRLLSQRDEAAATGRAGRELIERELNWERESARLIEGYETLRARAASGSVSIDGA